MDVDAEAAQAALADTDERFRLAMDFAAIGMCLTAPTGEFLRVNPALGTLLGRSPEELTDCTWQELTHPADLGSDLALVDEVLQGRRDGYRLLKRFCRPDGSVVESERLASLALAERERELRGVIDTLIDPWILLVAIRDDTGRIVDFEYVDANDAACAANRIERERLIGSRLMTLFPAHGPSGLLDAYARVVETGEPLTVDDEPFVDAFDGRERRFDNRAVRVGDGMTFTWRDVTDRYEARRLLREQADHDLLTGLANRRHLERRMAEIFARAPRTGAALAVLYCDVDLFKEINDSFGHAVGDEVLAGVGAAIRGAVRDADVVARVGGDEFVVILDGVASPSAAQAVAHKILRAVRRPMVVGGMTVEPRLSIGVAVTQYGRDPQDALARADVALYRAKHAGRDRVEVDRDVVGGMSAGDDGDDGDNESA